MFVAIMWALFGGETTLQVVFFLALAIGLRMWLGPMSPEDAAEWEEWHDWNDRMAMFDSDGNVLHEDDYK
ncbi:MAG: hypothetical protein N0E42_12170 [Candidatus Thiodiazotropha endolucinida]|nr:hypothetical protein [Candidatus Thiodiazotropha taylori]MCW4225227.1 hypothetical protein [Candidatus Thiodiazotropha endolucinida]MCG7880779.1 hypothetical protein [Candidatus Thiodiazotropha taylori]MCG7886798.1 hypothetical protein [Candidatus Thiodiazotropha taylori]MCG8028185.1 hypothetical protein [Candidatus Thiodiazotropha taylori]